MQLVGVLGTAMVGNRQLSRPTCGNRQAVGATLKPSVATTVH